MKLLAVLTAVLFLAPFASGAQSSSYTIAGGEDINKELTPAQRFLYPSFAGGHVLFRDGRNISASLNYNWVLGDVQFINTSGDTLSLANEATIKFISVNSDTFFYDKLYLRWMDGNDEVKLAKNEKLKLSNIKRTGAFNTQSSGAAVTTYTSVNTNKSKYSLDTNEELTVTTSTTYYLGDAYNHFIPFTKKNLLRKFSGNSSNIEAYLKSASTDFSKESDLRKLMTFLKSMNR